MPIAGELLAEIRDVLGAHEVLPAERIQRLWSGYGEVRRLRTPGAEEPTAIAKLVQPPDARDHPRGWVSDLSHRRKLRSYAVEQAFYRNQALRCDSHCTVPRTLHGRALDGGFLLVLQDMDAAGFPLRRGQCSDTELQACLAWLANFHATFLGEAPVGLWEVGTYWHLATRPEELAATADAALVAAAPLLDARLNGCRYRSLVHGDAKVANFCFSSDGARVAAVDFQYVGGGAGIKDVAYLLGSCMDDAGCEARADAALDHYFCCLRGAIARRTDGAVAVDLVDLIELEAEWRALYPVAWADFNRFLAGWAPDHAKLHGYSQRMTRRVLDGV